MKTSGNGGALVAMIGVCAGANCENVCTVPAWQWRLGMGRRAVWPMRGKVCDGKTAEQEYEQHAGAGRVAATASNLDARTVQIADIARASIPGILRISLKFLDFRDLVPCFL